MLTNSILDLLPANLAFSGLHGDRAALIVYVGWHPGFNRDASDALEPDARGDGRVALVMQDLIQKGPVNPQEFRGGALRQVRPVQPLP